MRIFEIATPKTPGQLRIDQLSAASKRIKVSTLGAFDDASQCPAPSVSVHMNNAKPWLTLADSRLTS